MSTATTIDPDTLAAAALLRALGPGRSFALSGVTWVEYEYLCEVRDEERPGVKIVFDRGELEAMSPLFVHDKSSRRLGHLVLVIAEELGVPVVGGGATTFRRRDRDVGLEPDECFYVRHAVTVLMLDTIDLAIQPPPDLAIEVDVTRRSVSKERVYAAIGVPELWRWSKDTITIRVLGPDGAYAAATASPSFPAVTAAGLTEFLNGHPGLDDIAFLKAARAWASQTLGRQPAGPTV